ncbi:MAG: hypothetical protein AAF740_00200 [Bacteroidota bacterium]
MRETQLPPEGLLRLTQTGYQVNITDYISDSFNILGKHAGGFVGFCLLASLLVIVGMVFAMFIPFVGHFLIFASAFALFAGMLTATHHIVREGTSNFGDFFKGFQKFVPFVLITLFLTVILFLVTAGMGGIFYLFGDFSAEGLERPEEFLSLFYTIEPALNAFLIVSAVIYMYFSTIYFLVIPLILFQNLSLWKAMEVSRKVVMKNFWPTLGLSLLLNLMISISGIIVIGYLVSYPISQIATYLYYNHLVEQAGIAGGDSFMSFDEDAPLDAGLL